MKKLTLYRFLNTKNGWGSEMVFASKELAEENLNFHQHWGGTVESFEGQIFETGDHIEVELHRGGLEDDDGITTGGGWIKQNGVVHVEWEKNGIPMGFLRNENGDHIQTMDFVAGSVNYPYRNARLINPVEIRK